MNEFFLPWQQEGTPGEERIARRRRIGEGLHAHVCLFVAGGRCHRAVRDWWIGLSGPQGIGRCSVGQGLRGGASRCCWLGLSAMVP